MEPAIKLDKRNFTATATLAIESIMSNKRVWSSPFVQAFMASTGYDDPVKAIRAEVQALLNKSKIMGPPILIRSLRPLCGIKKISKAEIDQDALLISQDDGFYVLINKDHSSNRQRFSCAHEIGHILLSQHYNRVIRSRTSNYVSFKMRDAEEEYLCNLAAAELLMPSKFFEPLIDKLNFSISSLPLLAKKFWVSIESTAMRLVQGRYLRVHCYRVEI